MQVPRDSAYNARECYERRVCITLIDASRELLPSIFSILHNDADEHLQDLNRLPSSEKERSRASRLEI